MISDQYFAVNFNVSAAAWAEITNIRAFYDNKSSDKADVIMIAWGTTILHDGRTHGSVIVGYYRRSERHAISDAIQILDGNEIVFFVNEETSQMFEGKTLDFREGLGFDLL